MTPLQWEIRNILKANRDGARTTQYQRHAMLFRFAGDLHQLGHRGLRLRGIGNRHVDAERQALHETDPQRARLALARALLADSLELERLRPLASAASIAP